MMKYENLRNKRYKEPEDGKFVDATKEILKAVSGDSNTDYHEEMEPVAALPALLADNFHLNERANSLVMKTLNSLRHTCFLLPQAYVSSPRIDAHVFH